MSQALQLAGVSIGGIARLDHRSTNTLWVHIERDELLTALSRCGESRRTEHMSSHGVDTGLRAIARRTGAGVALGQHCLDFSSTTIWEDFNVKHRLGVQHATVLLAVAFHRRRDEHMHFLGAFFHRSAST